MSATAQRIALALVLAAVAGGCASTVEECMNRLGSKDPEERMDAAVALGEMRGVKAVSLLEDLLARDEWPLVRASCARALARIGRPTSAAAFARALDDKDPLVRCEAVISLAALADTASAPVVSRLLREDPSSEVRKECAKALGALGAASEVPALIDALEDREETVRLQAELALRRLTCRDLGTVASDWREWYEDFRTRMEGEGG